MNINGGNCLEIKFIQVGEYKVMEYLEEPLPFTHVYLHKTSAYEDRDSLTERVFTSLYLRFGFELIRLIMPAAMSRLWIRQGSLSLSLSLSQPPSTFPILKNLRSSSREKNVGSHTLAKGS